MVNKRAAIGATLTWIVAIFIILFIMIIFLVAITELGFVKKTIGVNKNEQGNNNLVSTELALVYLNSEINGVKVKDYIMEVRERVPDFQEYTIDFFSDAYKKSRYKVRVTLQEFDDNGNPKYATPFVLTESYSLRSGYCFDTSQLKFLKSNPRGVVEVTVCRE